MSEIRQKYKAWALENMRPKVPPFEIWMAAYEAGEIAMREKAAQALESRPYYSNQTPDIIRALAISGAEEAKKEKAPDGIHEG